VTAVPESTPSAVDLTPYVPRLVVDWLLVEPEAFLQRGAQETTRHRHR
jgi:hypothetical protein